MTQIDPAQRFTRTHPCPVCGGYESLPQHAGARCWGFLSSDGAYAHCTREEYAGPLAAGPDGAYAHRLTGSCGCGTEHGSESEDSSMVNPPSIYPSTIERQNGRRGGHAAEGSSAIDYHYVSAAGELLASHRRIETGAGKRFIWIRPDGETGGITLAELPLYRVGDVLGADDTAPVYFTEGEKACEAARLLGVVATCLGGGAAQRTFGDAFAILRGRRVVVLPDNDDQGRRYAEHVALALRAHGAKPSILALPGLPQHADIVEWLAAGGTAEALHALSMGNAYIGGELTIEQPAAVGLGHPGIALRWLSAFLSEPPRAEAWLVDGLLLSGGSSILAAKPKTGKSTIARALLSCQIRGEPFLGRETRPGTAVYLAIEESPDQLREQMRALGLKDESLALHVGMIDARTVPPLQQLAAVIEETQAVLVVIDPLYKFIRVKDGNDYTEMSAVLEPLTDLARRSGCHICMIHHATKGGEGQEAILGSTALAGAVDTLLHLKRDGQIRTLSSTNRYGVVLESVVLTKADDGQVSISGTTFDVQVAVFEQRVMEAVYDGAFTDTQIVARVTGDANLSRFALRKLVTEGFVERRGTGRRGSPFEYFARREGS